MRMISSILASLAVAGFCGLGASAQATEVIDDLKGGASYALPVQPHEETRRESRRHARAYEERDVVEFDDALNGQLYLGELTGGVGAGAMGSYGSSHGRFFSGGSAQQLGAAGQARAFAVARAAAFARAGSMGGHGRR